MSVAIMTMHACVLHNEPAPQWVPKCKCTCACLTCSTAGPHTCGTSLVGRACWRIDVALQMGKAEGTCAIQQAIEIRRRQFAPCLCGWDEHQQ